MVFSKWFLKMRGCFGLHLRAFCLEKPGKFIFSFVLGSVWGGFLIKSRSETFGGGCIVAKIIRNNRPILS